LIGLIFPLHNLVKPHIALAQNKNNPSNNLTCPQDITNLASLLTRDISEYGNRIIQRSRIYSHKLDLFHTYIVTAGKVETKPLAFNQYQPSPGSIPDDVEQIFFTSLERQYSPSNRTIIETQNYHWLIMTKIQDRWKLVMALTKFGYPYQDKFITSPPRDTTNGIIGQAVKQWLKDCHYGTLRETQNIP
jgi:hypothetical protein